LSTAAAVLYVEDEVECVEIFLRESGFDVVSATDGAAALNALKGNVAPFRSLITDVDLGAELDGWEIARRARELNRVLPVVCVSGASGHEWKAKGVPNSIMIVQPFTPTQLMSAIASLLKEGDMTRANFELPHDSIHAHGDCSAS
jgi:DNA-binding response OmpR family regulator